MRNVIIAASLVASGIVFCGSVLADGDLRAKPAPVILADGDLTTKRPLIALADGDLTTKRPLIQLV